MLGKLIGKVVKEVITAPYEVVKEVATAWDDPKPKKEQK